MTDDHYRGLGRFHIFQLLVNAGYPQLSLSAQNDSKTIAYDPLISRPRRFGRSTCFLCSAPLRAKNRSDEHVFPKWLLQRFNLWDLKLSLLNGTDISYKQLTIPCCKTCNHYCPAKISEGRPNPLKISAITQGRSENDLN